jgi:hypothetical protein
VKRALKHRLLPGRQHRGDEGVCLLANALEIGGGDREQPGDRVSGLGARSWLRELQLELLLGPWMVETQPQQARNRLRAQVLRRRELRVQRRLPDRSGLGAKASGGDEPRVELAHRHEACGVGHGELHAEAREDVGEVPFGQRIVRPERVEARCHQPIGDHGGNLVCRP